MKYIIRYQVCLPLESGGSTVGFCKTLDEAKAMRTRDNYQIWKLWLQKNRYGNLYRVHAEQVV